MVFFLNLYVVDSHPHIVYMDVYETYSFQVSLFLGHCHSRIPNIRFHLFVLLEQLLINNITKTSNVILIRWSSALNLYVVDSRPHIVYMDVY